MLSSTRMESVGPPCPVPTSLHVWATIGPGIARGRPSGYALCPPTTQNAASFGRICVFCMKKLPPPESLPPGLVVHHLEKHFPRVNFLNSQTHNSYLPMLHFTSLHNPDCPQSGVSLYLPGWDAITHRFLGVTSFLRVMSPLAATVVSKH